MKHLTKIITSSKNDKYNTPNNVLSLVRQVAPIGLDPCSNGTSLVNAKTEWALPTDGLAQDWTGHGLVFVNPPYGRHVPVWMRKCRDEAAKGAEIIALVAAKVGTKWTQEIIYPSADGICHWRGRITFVGAKDPAPFESCLVYWGPNYQKFRAEFSKVGYVFQP